MTRAPTANAHAGTAEIPNVVSKTLANAKRALKNAGFEVGKVTQQTSSKSRGP